MTSGTPRPDLPAETAGIAGTAETTDLPLTPTLAGSDWQVDGPVVTASASWWNHLRCETCGHTFRAGEHVVIGVVVSLGPAMAEERTSRAAARQGTAAVLTRPVRTASASAAWSASFWSA
ncbi:hypothetical protein [Frankia tisae]|uniref:hypothetical protein n=1 Tax=Frankia tisae TaxID=2950104 RepID=UPI0021BE454F|nr:hypothetical protein [Frankia tisae]